MTLFYLNKETLKISWWYIYKKHAMNGRSFICGYGWVGFWSLLARHKNWLEPINCIFFNPCLLLMLLEFIKYLSHSQSQIHTHTPSNPILAFGGNFTFPIWTAIPYKQMIIWIHFWSVSSWSLISAGTIPPHPDTHPNTQSILGALSLSTVNLYQHPLDIIHKIWINESSLVYS